MIIVISDDTMEPIFGIGDYVGGNLVPGKYAPRYVGSICIVGVDNNIFYVRKIKQGSNPNQYDLVSININSTAKDCFLLNKEISSLAQIVWHRKNERIIY